MKTPEPSKTQSAEAREMQIPIGLGRCLQGILQIPVGATGVVLLAHGSGSSRHSPRNQYVADVIREAGFGTLLFDLLTPEEEKEDNKTGGLRFDIGLLSQRLETATRWMHHRPEARELALGYFGSSTGGAAALVAAADLGQVIRAVVSRGGRPDLAGNALPRVLAPTLLIVGEFDDTVLQLNERAFARLRCVKELQVVPGATHLFGEPGALESVSRLAAVWFLQHLQNRCEKGSTPSPSTG